MKNKIQHHIRLLTVADLHQSALHYRRLALATQKYRPDAVAVVGDALDAFEPTWGEKCSTAECAKMLAELPVEHGVMVRGNHEVENWTEFVAAWPHQHRPLIALYGSAFSIGPLTLVGFPCSLGSEFSWCSHLAADRDVMKMFPDRSRNELPADHKLWLPRLLRQTGHAGMTVWLMHVPPLDRPIAAPESCNPRWREAIQTFRPLLTISGHDHESPRRNNSWWGILGDTNCVNPGQSGSDLHFCVLDFEFSEVVPSLPKTIRVRAFPWGQEMLIP